MRPFLVCIHDATPAHEHETRAMVRDLAPLLGRRLSLGVVPDWHGRWPLAVHPQFCAFVREAAEELLLHGHVHRRRRGWGPVALLAERSDEMNGVDREETRRTIELAQDAFTRAFGAPAQGFLAPAWQRGHVRAGGGSAPGVEHMLGFFAIERASGARIPLATWSWDCGRWGWLGHVGHGVGRLSHALHRGVPSLAIHPRDLARGFWPRILGVVRELLDSGHEPTTAAGLLRARGC